MAGSATKQRRERAAAKPDTTKCQTEDCGHPRSEHVIDGKTCWGQDGACPCKGFAATEEEAAARGERELTNAETLPPTGPMIAADIRTNKDGSPNQADLEKATVPENSPGSDADKGQGDAGGS